MGPDPIFQRCYYYLTYRCDSRCRYCDIWRTVRLLREEQGANVVRRRIDELKQLGVSYIDFTGGEVLLRDDLVEILSHAKGQGFPTIFVTNGLIYKKRADELLGVADFINFSLDTLDRQDYAARRGVDALPHVISAMEYAAEIGQQFGIIATIDDGNIDSIEPLAELAGKFGTQVSINPVFSYFGNPELARDAVRRIKDAASHPAVYVNEAQLDLIASGGNDIDSPSCRAMSRNIVISPDGYLLMPCFHHQMDRQYIEGGICEALESKAAATMRGNEGRFPFCRGCTINCYMDTANLRIEELLKGTVTITERRPRCSRGPARRW